MARSTRAKRKTMDGQTNDLQQPVVKLPPDEPAARDEGPRLIPFPAERGSLELPRVKHYLDLAEKALEHGRKKTE